MKIVFATVIPDKDNRWPKYIDDIESAAEYAIGEKAMWLVHPNYNMKSGAVVELFKYIGSFTESGKVKDILDKDKWLIERSSVMLYDIDVNLGYHYLMAAAIFNIPVIGVSQYLNGIGSPYFSPYVSSIIKPENVVQTLEGMAIPARAT